MAEQNWLRHTCDKIPDPHNYWINTSIIKAPNQNHRNGELYGQISWKLFKFIRNILVDFAWIPTNDGKELNPPICPFCGTSLTEEEEKS